LSGTQKVVRTPTNPLVVTDTVEVLVEVFVQKVRSKKSLAPGDVLWNEQTPVNILKKHL
jgi:hypothetical protein